MSNIKKVKGIVLRATKYSEADLILQLILTNGEKISVLARGAVKSKKRFVGGVLEPTHFIEAHCKLGASSDKMGVLQEAVLLESFPGLRTDYERLETALFCLSTMAKLSQEGDGNSEGLFNLLGHALRSLENCKNFEVFKTAFGLKILFQQGVLETEPWMTSFLKPTLKQVIESENEMTVSHLQNNWVQAQLAHYLQTAGTHSASF